MSDSLRDQLLGLGFKPAPKPERKPQHGAQHGSSGKGGKGGAGARTGKGAPPAQAGKPARNKPARSQEDIDLAKAYAIRAQREKDERIEAERLKQEQARQRREAKAKLEAFLKDKTLNDPAAEIARHFEYGGKIKRIHVTEAQLKALNAGELGVAQLNGRYLLVTSQALAESEAIFPHAVALKVDPDAPAEADPYSDPRYQVPDDLVW